MLFQCIHGRGGGFIRPLRASPATARKTKTRTMILGRPENNRGPTKKQHSPITGPETHVVIALPPPSPLPPRQRHASACRAAPPPPPPPPGNGRVYFRGRLAPGFGNSPRWGEEENFAFQPGRTAVAPGGAPLPRNISEEPSVVPPPRTMAPPLRQTAPPPAGVLPLQDSPFPGFLPHSLFNVTGTSSAPPPRRPHPSSFTEVSAASLP
jgi:hypothetical protein